jgi:DNA-binding CsgD family transcriptional regulator
VTATGHRGAAAARLVGRERELAAIDAARAEPGCPGVVIVGAAGVGKTRLAREAVAGAGEDGSALEWAQATRSAASIPLAAFSAVIPSGARTADPLQLFQASTDAILARANGLPVVLGLDDAHLLDQASAALTLQLAMSGSAFVVATVRAGDPPPDAIVALWKDAGARRLELAELSEDETVALTEELLGGPVEQVAAQWAYATSAGNPLYLRELVTAALDSGALAREETLWRLHRRPQPGPALAELVARRLEGLEDAGRELLALVGLGEPLGVAAATEIAGPEAIAAVEVRGLIVVDRDLARLAHPLYGEVVLSELPAARAATLRVRLADALRTRGLEPGDAVRVATWLRDAGAPVEPDLLVEAAGDAYRACDPQLAAELAAEAEAAGVGAAATLVRGHAQALLGRYEESERTFARVHTSLPNAGRAQPLLTQDGAVGYLFTRARTLSLGLGRSDDAEQVVAQAAGWWPDVGWRYRVEGMRLAAFAMNGRARESGELADRLAADPQLPAAMAPLVAAAGAVGWAFAGQTAKAQRVAERALPFPPSDERLTEPEIGGLFAWSAARLLSGRDWDGLEARVARIEHAAVRRGDRGLAGVAACILGGLALGRGTAATAARRLREAVAHLELRDSHHLVVAAALELAQAEALLGRLDAARQAGKVARTHLGARRMTSHEWPWLARADAWIAAAGGEFSHAVEILRDSAAATAEWPTVQAEQLHQALSAGGDAHDLAAELATVAGRCDAPLAAAYAAHAAALAANDGAALERAAEELATIGAALAAAEAAAQAAAIHEADGRASSAQRAAALSARVQAECEGATTPALRATDPAAAALTRREREIAELAAAGSSNAEIAERLVISVRTVESHLYHAMIKLGAGRREQLADRLRSNAAQ